MNKIYILALISSLTVFSKGYGIDKMNKPCYNYGYQKYGKGRCSPPDEGGR